MYTDLKELHGEVNAIGIAVGDLEVAGPCRTSAGDDGVVLLPELLSIDVNSDVSVRDEGLKECERHNMV